MASKRHPRVSKQPRDGGVTRDRILDAAEAAFAQGGLFGTRVEQIIEKSGVTKAMVYYYFGDKEGLYFHVMERALTQRMEKMAQLDTRRMTPVEALYEVASVWLDEGIANQNWPVILFYEAIQNQGRYYTRIMQRQQNPLQEVLQRGIAEGVFKIKDARHAVVNIIGICQWYFCVARNLSELWPPGTDMYAKEMMEKHKQQALQQIITGVMPMPSSHLGLTGKIAHIIAD